MVVCDIGGGWLCCLGGHYRYGQLYILNTEKSIWRKYEGLGILMGVLLGFAQTGLIFAAFCCFFEGVVMTSSSLKLGKGILGSWGCSMECLSPCFDVSFWVEIQWLGESQAVCLPELQNSLSKRFYFDWRKHFICSQSSSSSHTPQEPP